jgi:steroid delta-isomerase-like uncharacterized protein
MTKFINILLPVIVILVLVGCAGQKTIEEKNKALASRWCDEVWNKGNTDVLDELLSVDFVFDYAAPGVSSDIEGYKQMINIPGSPFTEISTTNEDMVAQGNLVAVRWTWEGTHSGDYMGMAPTDKEVTLTGMSILKIADGKIVQEWGQMDQMGMMLQLGVIPAIGRENYSWGESMKAEARASSDPEKTRALYLRELELWNKRELTIADEVFSENFQNYDPAWPMVVDLESYKQWVSDMFATAPGMQITVDILIVEGNKAAGFWTAEWTDTVGMMGNKPTGKKITVPGMDIIRCKGGKIIERWWAKDFLGAAQQLGMVSSPPPPPPPPG